MVELIVVLAIISILAAITFPIIASARLAGRKTATISNLRQCGVALAIYNDESGDLPNRHAVYDALSKAPICDSFDPWLKGNCPKRIGNRWLDPMDTSDRLRRITMTLIGVPY